MNVDLRAKKYIYTTSNLNNDSNYYKNMEHMVEIRRKESKCVYMCIIRDRWTLKKSEKAKIKRNESNLTQREHSYNRH